VRMLSCPAVPRTPQSLHRPATLEKPSFGLSGGIGCLAVIALCVGLAVAVHGALPPAGDGGPVAPWAFAAVIGTLAGLGLYSLVSVALGYGRGAGGRAALHARARTDGPIDDGQPIIATGVVRADRPLTSPLGGVACAAYDYRMFVHTRNSKGGQDETPVYWGYAVRPFAIDSRARSYPVAGTLLPGERTSRLTGDAAVARARAYVRSTGWETVEYRMLGTLDTVFQRAREVSVDGVRRDFAVPNDAAPDVAILQLEESVLPLGATVSAFGTWSGSQGAIVAPPSPLPASFVVIAEGGPEALDGKPGIPTSTTGYLVGAFAMMAVAAAVFWVATRILPTVGR
jgi:hypothetical protein